MRKLMICIFCLVSAVSELEMVAVSVSQDILQQVEPRITAYVLDSSGSMKKHGFNEAKEALIDKIKHIKRRDVGYVIPFAENDRDFLRVVYEDTLPPRFQAVESFIRNLTADGQYTNFDEGLDKARILLMEESGEGIRNIILISDGLSDPDPHHNEIKLEDLASRVPRGIFSFYIIDLSNNKYPGLSATTIGSFTGYSQSGSSLVVIPLEDAVRLRDLFTELDKGAEENPPSVDENSEQVTEKQELPVWLSRYGIPLMLLSLLLITFLILKLRKSANLGPVLFEGAEVDTADNDAEQKSRNGMVRIKVGDTERSFGAPVMLTVGSRRKDDFTVKGARRRELSVLISDDRQQFTHRQGLIKRARGPIFRSRSFLLSTGTPVVVRLQADASPLHRYLK